jgi:hypothetical protein
MADRDGVLRGTAFRIHGSPRLLARTGGDACPQLVKQAQWSVAIAAVG